MNTISLQIPDSLHEQMRELALRDNISIDQLIILALAEKISALMTEEYLIQRAKRGSQKNFQQALGKVADIEPEEIDKL